MNQGGKAELNRRLNICYDENGQQTTTTRRLPSQPLWLLSVFTWQGKGASLRVTVWRKLQRCGALPSREVRILFSEHRR